jgi:hypothetical protein
MLACSSGLADEVATEAFTTDGVHMAVGIELGDSEVGIPDPAVEGGGFA